MPTYLFDDIWNVGPDDDGGDLEEEKPGEGGEESGMPGEDKEEPEEEGY